MRTKNSTPAPWDEREGHIKRSIRFDDQVAFQRGEMYYTSIIVDARKGSWCVA